MRLGTKVTITTSALLIVGAFGTVFSRRMQNKPVKFDKKSKSSAVEISNIELKNDAAIVTLKNVSTKNVNGIQLSSNKGSVRIEFLDADEPDHQRLLPGATFQQMFPSTNPSELFEVIVLAVAFEDKSSDGDPESAKEITDSRRGFNKELKRMRPLLEAALASQDGDSPAILDKLNSQVEALPLEQSADSTAFQQGQRAAREQIMHDVQFLKDRHSRTGQVQIRRALASAKNRYDKRIDTDF